MGERKREMRGRASKQEEMGSEDLEKRRKKKEKQSRNANKEDGFAGILQLESFSIISVYLELSVFF